MTGPIDARLSELGLTLPEPATPIANYVPAVIAGSLLVISGQIPMQAGRIAVTGKLGQGVGPEAGREAARTCFLNVLAQARAALGGDLGRVRQGRPLQVLQRQPPEAPVQDRGGPGDPRVALHHPGRAEARIGMGLHELRQRHTPGQAQRHGLAQRVQHAPEGGAVLGQRQRDLGQRAVRVLGGAQRDPVPGDGDLPDLPARRRAGRVGAGIGTGRGRSETATGAGAPA